MLVTTDLISFTIFLVKVHGMVIKLLRNTRKYNNQNTKRSRLTELFIFGEQTSYDIVFQYQYSECSSYRKQSQSYKNMDKVYCIAENSQDHTMPQRNDEDQVLTGQFAKILIFKMFQKHLTLIQLKSDLQSPFCLRKAPNNKLDHQLSRNQCVLW